MMSKWISADSIINKFNSHVGFTTCADVKRAIKLIQDEPGIDLVRCKECKWAKANGTYQWCGRLDSTARITADDFCSYGERREP